MNRTTWICQSSRDANSSTAMLKRACGENLFPFIEIDVIARSNLLPAMPVVDGPFVLHGKTTLMLCAAADPLWHHGLFYDHDQFRHSAYRDHYGRHLLNAEAQVVSMDEFFAKRNDWDFPLFIKPNDDLKYFAGDVLPSEEWRRLFTRLIEAKAVTGSSEIVVCQPKEVDAEWRLFIVNGRVVSGSMYRPSGDPFVPQEVICFAESCARIWTPSPVFVMDIARSGGAWAVVECNCFNGSRFYHADVGAIVCAVSEFQESLFP